MQNSVRRWLRRGSFELCICSGAEIGLPRRIREDDGYAGDNRAMTGMGTCGASVTPTTGVEGKRGLNRGEDHGTFGGVFEVGSRALYMQCLFKLVAIESRSSGGSCWTLSEAKCWQVQGI